MIKKTLIVLLLAFSVWLSYPNSVSAAIPNPFSLLSELSLPFGGLVPCTCPSSAGNLWIYFTPLFLGSGTPVTGSLVYIPAKTRLYSWYAIGTPTTWHLGTFTPGIQACFMVAPPPATGCVPFPAAGVINEVGTSKPIGF